MSHKTAATVAHTIGIDTGKNTLHLIGSTTRGQSFCGRRLPAAGSRPGSPMCRAGRWGLSSWPDGPKKKRTDGPMIVL